MISPKGRISCEATELKPCLSYRYARNPIGMPEIPLYGNPFSTIASHLSNRISPAKQTEGFPIIMISPKGEDFLRSNRTKTVLPYRYARNPIGMPEIPLYGNPFSNIASHLSNRISATKQTEGFPTSRISPKGRISCEATQLKPCLPYR